MLEGGPAGPSFLCAIELVHAETQTCSTIENMIAPDEPGLLAALVGQRGDLAGVKALLAEGGIVERPPGDLRQAARRHGFRPAQVRRLLLVRELARRWHVPPDSAGPPINSPREALLQFQDLRSSPKECFA